MVTTSNQSLIALPAFMRFLSTYPDPQEVCEALLSGPLAHFDAKSVNMFLTTPTNTYKIVGTTGITAPLVPRYMEMSRALHTPLNEAVLEGEIVTTSILKQLDDYPSLAIDRTIWEDVANTAGDLRIDTIPIVSNGKSIGAYDMFAEGVEPSRKDYAFLSSLGHLLGVWATHPYTENSLESEFTLNSDEVSFILNERQLHILELVEQGRSNSAIALILGYSQSTVKQELQRAMRVLRTNERSEAAKRARELGLHPAE